jgi:hypothetical protein
MEGLTFTAWVSNLSFKPNTFFLFSLPAALGETLQKYQMKWQYRNLSKFIP